MKWLLTRLLVICLTLGVFCAAAIVVERLDHSPSKLQALGIDICDDEPCFRGIRLGTPWATVISRFPSGVKSQVTVEIDNLDGISTIGFHPSPDTNAVDALALAAGDLQTPLPFNAEDIIAQYGAPCLIDPTGITDFVAYYPSMTVFFLTIDKDGTEGKLQLYSPVLSIYVQRWSQNVCVQGANSGSVPWRGFTSAQGYYQHNLTDLGMVQPTPDNP